mmetsp:Transcript_15756/g.34101  ORF Transcript_15756/g.34101 Transcript_15756/m.34101 type:complete len:209 (-) Transcript_15756:132-758(-)
MRESVIHDFGTFHLVSSPLLVQKRKQYVLQLSFHVTVVHLEVGPKRSHDVVHSRNTTPKGLLDFVHSLGENLFARQVSGCGLCHESGGCLRRRLLNVWTPKGLRRGLLLLLLLLLRRGLSIELLALWLRLPLLNVARKTGMLLLLLLLRLLPLQRLLLELLKAASSGSPTAVSIGTWIRSSIAAKATVVSLVSRSAVKACHCFLFFCF